MRLQPGIQEALIALLCYGDKAAAKLAASLVPWNLYDAGFRDVAEVSIEYLERFDQPAGEHTLDLFDSLKRKNERGADIYEQIFDSLQETKEGVNEDFVLDQAKLFARYQRLKTTVADAIEMLERGDKESLDQAEASLLKLQSDPNDLLDLGTGLKDTDRALKFLDEVFDVFPTGIPAFDEMGYGPFRKGLHLFLAPPNAGKSWWLIHLGKQALMHRKRVLHLTLEMSESKVAMRYVQALFGLPKRKIRQHLPMLDIDETGTFAGFDVDSFDPELALQDNNVRGALTKKLKSTFSSRPNLLIKEFPSGSLTMGQLEAYLDFLSSREGFHPDLILVDYADLMSQDAKNLRESIGQTIVKLRGLATSRNCAVATASQTNRAGARAELVRNEDAAEDYSKVFTADTIITFNRTDLEEKLSLARLFVSKARDEARHTLAVIAQGYSIGQFAMDSARFAAPYWDVVKQEDDSGHRDDE